MEYLYYELVLSNKQKWTTDIHNNFYGKDIRLSEESQPQIRHTVEILAVQHSQNLWRWRED